MSFVSHFYGTAAVLAARNPLVPKGGVAAESDTGVVKIGDGVTRYNSLSTALNSTYAALSAAGGDALRTYRDVPYAPLNASLAAGGSYSLILGHSVVAGSGSSGAGYYSFPVLVKSQILSIDQTATVTIDGNAGYTSTQLVAKHASDSTLANYQALTIFMGLLNDYSGGIAPATSQANIAALVAKMKAIQPAGSYPAPAFLILIEWTRTDVSSPAYPWSQYVAAAKAVAAADSTVTVLDLSSRLGSPAVNTLAVFDVDHIHPTDKGHALIAKAVVAEILSSNTRTGNAPGNITIPAALMAPTAQTNWSTVSGGTGGWGGSDRETDGTQNATITYEFLARAGTYSVNLYHRNGSNRGIYSVYTDGGVQTATKDGYNSTPNDLLATMSGTVILVGDGLHTITLKMATKNASSSSYVGSISGIFLNRTGA